MAQIDKLLSLCTYRGQVGDQYIDATLLFSEALNMVGRSIDCAERHCSEMSAELCAHTRHECLNKLPVHELAFPTVSKTTSPASDDEGPIAAYESGMQTLLHTHMPTTTGGLTTFGHQRALLNRLRAPEAAEDFLPDTENQKPTFIFLHDTLMLPGTLAQLLRKASPEDLISNMTPALLAGFHAHIDTETTQPVLVASQRQEDIVQGMVVCGLDKEARDTIREYYRRFAHRHRALVGIDVCLKTASENQTSSDDQWHIERRIVRAYVWSQRSLVDCERAAKDGGSMCPDWHLRDALEGRLAPRDGLRIEPDGKGDEAEGGYIGRDIVEYESEPEEKERIVVYGGAGHLDYLRASYNTGW